MRGTVWRNQSSHRILSFDLNSDVIYTPMFCIYWPRDFFCRFQFIRNLFSSNYEEKNNYFLTCGQEMAKDGFFLWFSVTQFLIGIWKWNWLRFRVRERERVREIGVKLFGSSSDCNCGWMNKKLIWIKWTKMCVSCWLLSIWLEVSLHPQHGHFKSMHNPESIDRSNYGEQYYPRGYQFCTSQ